VYKIKKKKKISLYKSVLIHTTTPYGLHEKIVEGNSLKIKVIN
jgi:hypothetical protein